MTYAQYRRARKLVRQCCNYESGTALPLTMEFTEPLQSIFYSLLCNWFRAAVLPLDELWRLFCFIKRIKNGGLPVDN